ncbi:MAG: hypothetical protein V4568_06380 [Pseudomonadota bacterium]
MDVLTGLKSEIFRPAITFIIPGILAGTPYFFVLEYFYSDLSKHVTDHPTLSTFLSAVVSTAFGLIAYELGTSIENNRIDVALKKADPLFEDEWYKYLRCTFPVPPVAEDYIHNQILFLKFELSAVAALLISFPGTFLAWFLQGHPGYMSSAIVAASFMFGIRYFYKEAESSAKILARVRKEILKGVGCPPSCEPEP